MIQFEVSRLIALPARQLWPLLGRFSRLPDWFPGVDGFRCEGDTPGSLRHIRIGPFEVTQELLEQDNTAFRTVYQVTAGPGISPATGLIVRIALTEEGSHSRLHWEARLAALPTTLPAGSEEAFTARTRKNYEHALDHLEQVIARATPA